MKRDLNYYKLSLQEFLQNSHPHLLDDDELITARADLAAEAYEQAIRSGNNQVGASEEANEVLFAGLHFSKHDTLVNILWNEFSNEIPEDEAKSFAIEILPECEPIFDSYSLSDEFAYSHEYELLYTELTGTIALIIENRSS
jgi:hypothetical protein